MTCMQERQGVAAICPRATCVLVSLFFFLRFILTFSSSVFVGSCFFHLFVMINYYDCYHDHYCYYLFVFPGQVGR